MAHDTPPAAARRRTPGDSRSTRLECAGFRLRRGRLPARVRRDARPRPSLRISEDIGPRDPQRPGEAGRRAHMNRRAEEPSPYLRRHKENPFDCYPWGDEVFGRATAEDKPVL